MCKHENKIKVMEIPMNNEELDYETMFNSLIKIKDNVANHEWTEMLVCLDCDTVLEINTVFNPSNTPTP